MWQARLTWVANRPGRGLAERAIDLILNPSASHFAFGNSEVRKRLVLDASRAFAATYVYANLVGNEAELVALAALIQSQDR